MTQKLTIENMPTDVLSTWDEWRDNFDESTPAKKKETAARLEAHRAACEKNGLDFSDVGVVLFKRPKNKK